MPVGYLPSILDNALPRQGATWWFLYL